MNIKTHLQFKDLVHFRSVDLAILRILKACFTNGMSIIWPRKLIAPCHKEKMLESYSNKIEISHLLNVFNVF